MEGTPCPDCQWTMYLMTGRPIVLVRCPVCKNWYHANVKVRGQTHSIIGSGLELAITINHDATKKTINSILRCDCLAKQVYLVSSIICQHCQRNDSNSPPREHTHVVTVRRNNTLHEFMLGITPRKYKHSRLPAYSLQRRCGAVSEYFDTYVDQIMTEKQRKSTMAYRDKRLTLREAHDARQDDPKRSTPDPDEQ